MREPSIGPFDKERDIPRARHAFCPAPALNGSGLDAEHGCGPLVAELVDEIDQ